MGHFPNLPHKYSPDAQEERNWKAKNKREGREGLNYNYAKYDKEKYRKNYDEIDWSK
tara:strand:- start:568 stop:738 length:171 start_codon:yes stop_codon:yes gene_type:complete